MRENRRTQGNATGRMMALPGSRSATQFVFSSQTRGNCELTRHDEAEYTLLTMFRPGLMDGLRSLSGPYGEPQMAAALALPGPRDPTKEFASLELLYPSLLSVPSSCGVSLTGGIAPM